MNSTPAFSFGELETLHGCAFEQLPPARRERVYGVEYARLEDEKCGQLFVTRNGWPFIENLLPQSWYENRRYAACGERLLAGTSAVYRVPTRNARGQSLDLIVKFSRFAREVPLQIAQTFPSGVPPEVIENARFNCPFREFGLLREMRLGRFGPPELKLRTKHALAIYSPAREYSDWQMDREQWMFDDYQRDLKRETHDELELNARREYVVLYAWIKGRDAQEMHERGLLDAQELEKLTRRATREMEQKGFRVLDNKPRHFILRERENGALLRRNGELIYALIDFELLQRTEEYEAFLQSRAL